MDISMIDISRNSIPRAAATHELPQAKPVTVILSTATPRTAVTRGMTLEAPKICL
jgi:hypothetical protein